MYVPANPYFNISQYKLRIFGVFFTLLLALFVMGYLNFNGPPCLWNPVLFFLQSLWGLLVGYLIFCSKAYLAQWDWQLPAKIYLYFSLSMDTTKLPALLLSYYQRYWRLHSCLFYDGFIRTRPDYSNKTHLIRSNKANKISCFHYFMKVLSIFSDIMIMFDYLTAAKSAPKE